MLNCVLSAEDMSEKFTANVRKNKWEKPHCNDSSSNDSSSNDSSSNDSSSNDSSSNVSSSSNDSSNNDGCLYLKFNYQTESLNFPILSCHSSVISNFTGEYE